MKSPSRAFLIRTLRPELVSQMPGLHMVRVGAMGFVGRFLAGDAVRYPRRSRVIVRTVRGLEIGEVLSLADETAARDLSDGTIVRGMTVEDELLQARLNKHRRQALDACSALLDARGLDATLLDAESLFDGQSLYFYFLGDVSPAVAELTAELAETYDAKVQMRKFTELLTEGCGPGCGTEAATGGGQCTTCASCAIGCSTRRSAPAAKSSS